MITLTDTPHSLLGIDDLSAEEFLKSWIVPP